METNNQNIQGQDDCNERIGQYKIIQEIGQGASCTVKMALDTERDENVAIKILNHDQDRKKSKF